MDDKALEYILNDIKKDIEKLNDKFKELFGNGKPGMCTRRQSELKQWVELELTKIKTVPTTVYNWIFRIGTITGLFVNALVFLFIFFKYVGSK